MGNSSLSARGHESCEPIILSRCYPNRQLSWKIILDRLNNVVDRITHFEWTTNEWMNDNDIVHQIDSALRWNMSSECAHLCNRIRDTDERRACTLAIRAQCRALRSAYGNALQDASKTNSAHVFVQYFIKRDNLDNDASLGPYIQADI